MHGNKRIWTLILFFISLSYLFLQPKPIYAHSALLEANPSINSHVDEAPAQISLKFNERLEKEIYYIHLFDEQGKLVTQNPTKMSEDQTQIYIDLPHLNDGNYTVSYQVISADGHPLSQAYLLSVGNVAEKYDPSLYANTADHGDPFTWFIRTMYYFTLLAVCGLIFWKYIFVVQSKEGKGRYNQWFKYAKWLCFSFVLLIGIIQFFNVLQEFGIKDVPAAFLNTTSGQAWCSSLVIILVGTFVFGKRKWLDFLLAFLLIVAEAINGHAVTNHPVVLSVMLDIIHLSAASIWLGGLAYLLILWQSLKKEREAFLMQFSKFAFWSIMALISSGIILSFIFVPSLTFLLRTQWGILIFVKTVLTIGVIAVAFMVRKGIAAREESKFQFWLKWDYAILCIIIFIVGGLTIASPIPTNDPLIWKARQNNLLMNMEITPNNPGVNNTFNVSVEMPKDKKVKVVKMTLTHEGEQKIAPITVPLKPLQNNTPDFNRYSFTSVGPFISLPGTWTVDLDVYDEEYNWTGFKNQITVYPILKK